MAAIDLLSTVVHGDSVVFQILDGDAVLLNLDRGIYFGLNAVGARIWELIGERGKLALVLEDLLKEYAVDESRLREDLLRLVQELIDEGLVKVTNA